MGFDRSGLTVTGVSKCRRWLSKSSIAAAGIRQMAKVREMMARRRHRRRRSNQRKSITRCGRQFRRGAAECTAEPEATNLLHFPSNENKKKESKKERNPNRCYLNEWCLSPGNHLWLQVETYCWFN